MTRPVLVSLGLAVVLFSAVIGAFALNTRPAEATPHTVPVTLSAAKAESANPGATGSGSGTVTYDFTTNTLSWNFSWSGTQGNTTVAHFHGPAMQGVSAGIRVTITDIVSPSTGSAVITDMDESQLIAGLWYINVHTDHSPLGEIRGQVFGPIGGVAEIDDSVLAGGSGTNLLLLAGLGAAALLVFGIVGGGAYVAVTRRDDE
jgi:hypothetical protein